MFTSSCTIAKPVERLAVLSGTQTWNRSHSTPAYQAKGPASGAEHLIG